MAVAGVAKEKAGPAPSTSTLNVYSAKRRLGRLGGGPPTLSLPSWDNNQRVVDTAPGGTTTVVRGCAVPWPAAAASDDADDDDGAEVSDAFPADELTENMDRGAGDSSARVVDAGSSAHLALPTSTPGEHVGSEATPASLYAVTHTEYRLPMGRCRSVTPP
jgi:hypothetical protein